MLKRALVTLAVTIPVLGAAQGRGPELSVSLASIATESCSGCNSNYSFQVGPAGLALAFYSSEKVALQPALTLYFQHRGNDSFDGFSYNSNSTAALLSLGIPYYPDGGYGHRGFYLEPVVAMLYYKESGSSSQTQVGFGGAIGHKSRMNERVSLGLGLGAIHYLEKKDFLGTHTDISAQFGMSVFLK